MDADAAIVARSEPIERLRLTLTGIVQGVGFRPFVYCLARRERLCGFVRNTGAGVLVEVEGEASAIQHFVANLQNEAPPRAKFHARQAVSLAPQGETGFTILSSDEMSARSAVVMADLGTCPACLSEILDSTNRRYFYPFTSCVDCGPRYSIMEALPYDRARTTMRHFPLCAACEAEYHDPDSRRFRAEASACADCGPQLTLWDSAGTTFAIRHAALHAAADALRAGAIIALKGLGGFQLLADAGNEEVVARLRARKRRPTKPLALMVPTLDDAEAIAAISFGERRVLTSPEAPIVLLRRRMDGAPIAPGIGPGNPNLGIMLPYTGLHHLLLREFAGPLVATSGNVSDEPIVADEAEALRSLAGIADFFLVHNRPIARPIDDSVVRCVGGDVTVLRRARGYAPMPIPCSRVTAPLVALGGEQKSAIATAFNGEIFLGPHIGDLHGPEGRAAFGRAVEGLTALHHVVPSAVACDAHPDFYSTRHADRLGPPVEHVPHHLAHVLAGMVENDLDGPVLGVAWDGAGYGTDGMIWGGEFLLVDGARFRRVAHFRPFRLPGGAIAMREPRRAALAALHATFGQKAFAMTALPTVAAFTPNERAVLATMLERGANAPLTSSVGRLFDAAASLLGLHQVASFEGEAAMALEFAAGRAKGARAIPSPSVVPQADGPLIVDWRPTFAGIVAALEDGAAIEPLAAAFHDALVEAVIMVARQVGIRSALMTGGCFQNARLIERAVARLRAEGFTPYWHHLVPPNDGGLAVGQIAFAARPLIEETA